MSRNSKRKKGSFVKRNRIAILVLSFLLLYLSITIVNQEMKLRDLQQEGDQLQNRVDELNKEVSKMEKKVEESASLEFIEKTAREKLKMVKQNEIIYIIQDEKESD
tara:strand:+ start:720 stop:1037 length:318 start_codon:yes stop_codon:yes gene_type:complete